MKILINNPFFSLLGGTIERVCYFNMIMKDLNDYMENQGNLPDFIKDFHDQKDLFKTIHTVYSDSKSLEHVNWVNAHMYTIDCFLWFMGKHGYKLQKDRTKNIDFYNIYETIKNKDFNNG